jgi:recombination protein RecA
VKKSGAWYTYEGDQLGQGKENSRNYLINNPKVAEEIEKKIKSKLGIGVPRAVADLPIEDDVVIDEVIEAAAPKAANA